MARVLASELKPGDKLAAAGGVLTIKRAETAWPTTVILASDQAGRTTGWVRYNAHDEFDTVTLH